MVGTRKQSARDESSARPTSAQASTSEIEELVRQDTPEPSGSHTRTGIATEQEVSTLRKEVEQLQALAKLQKEAAELRKKIKGKQKSTSHRHSSHSTSSSDEKEVKIKSFTQFTSSSGLRKRDDWLNDLQRAFIGSKSRYKKDYKKILLALDHMDADCRARWDRYLDEQPSDEIKEALENSWADFKEWTLTILKDSTNREVLLIRSLEQAQQRDKQSPRDFHLYLDSLEKHFPRVPEKQRALSFYAKLNVDLQEHINLHATGIPDTREGVVTLATRFWDSMTSSNKRKFSDGSEKSESRSKTTKGNHKDSPSSYQRRTDHSSGKGVNFQWERKN